MPSYFFNEFSFSMISFSTYSGGRLRSCSQSSQVLFETPIRSRADAWVSPAASRASLILLIFFLFLLDCFKINIEWRVISACVAHGVNDFIFVCNVGTIIQIVLLNLCEAFLLIVAAKCPIGIVSLFDQFFNLFFGGINQSFGEIVRIALFSVLSDFGFDCNV